MRRAPASVCCQRALRSCPCGLTRGPVRRAAGAGRARAAGGAGPREQRGALRELSAPAAALEAWPPLGNSVPRAWHPTATVLGRQEDASLVVTDARCASGDEQDAAGPSGKGGDVMMEVDRLDKAPVAGVAPTDAAAFDADAQARCDPRGHRSGLWHAELRLCPGLHASQLSSPAAGGCMPSVLQHAMRVRRAAMRT